MARTSGATSPSPVPDRAIGTPPRTEPTEQTESGAAERLTHHLETHPELLPDGATILVALSGGPDSVALLHLLRAQTAKRGWRLVAAHFDHGLRPESAQQAEAVRRGAEAAGIACAVGCPTSGIAGGQAGFRSARYIFLEAEADRVGADRIATAHHADDQAETVLFRLLRGTGLRGLAGIPSQRGPIVRPLLELDRQTLRRYLETHDIGYLEDPSNLDLRWTRAWIRHRLLPALEREAACDVRRTLCGIAAAAERLNGLSERRAAVLVSEATQTSPDREPTLRFDRERFLSYDRWTQSVAVRLIARRFEVSPTRGGTRSVVEFIRRGRSGTAIDLSKRLQVGREFGDLWFGPPVGVVSNIELCIPGPEPGEGQMRLGGTSYQVRWRPRLTGEAKDSAEPSISVPGGGGYPLRVRGVRPGDRIRLRAGSRKLKKVLIDRRVPRSRRASCPVVQSADGRILWAAGLPAYDGDPERGLWIEIEDGALNDA